MYIFLFNHSRFFQGGVGAVFLNSFESASGNHKIKRFFELGHINLLFLKIGIFANLARGIEFGGTRDVGIPPAHN